jgi:predicted dienelactone hydrolase
LNLKGKLRMPDWWTSSRLRGIAPRPAVQRLEISRVMADSFDRWHAGGLSHRDSLHPFAKRQIHSFRVLTREISFPFPNLGNNNPMLVYGDLLKPTRVFFAVIFLAAPRYPMSAATDPAPVDYLAAGTNQVEIFRYEWRDARRDRKLPVKIYLPKSSATPFPVIIFSHGLGGSREAYEFLGRYWAERSYVSVHLQHIGSDAAVWQDKPASELMPSLRRSAASLTNAFNRPLDVTFALDQLEKLNREFAPFKNKFDLTKVGVAGHSFGAFTTLAIGGQVFIGQAGREISFVDARVKAAIPLSSPVPARKDQLDRAFGKIKIPMLHMTGTEDSSPIGETSPTDRRVPFDHIHGADQFLITLMGGDHMIFAGHYGKPQPAKEEVFKKLIRESSLAFWDAYLKNDSKAKAWLTNDFKRVLGTEGTFEMKLLK